MMQKSAFLGIDLGTTGIRAILTDEKGRLLSIQKAGIEDSFVQSDNNKLSEQNAQFWEPALFKVLNKIFLDIDHYHLKAISVDSTSGTIIPIDKNHKPLYYAILHNDFRAHVEADFIRRYTKLNVKPSFALSKVLWIKKHRPEIFAKVFKFVHAADYINGILSGEYETTDFSNSLKTGYDIFHCKWPDSISSILEIPNEKLPRVVKTGEVIGELKKSIRQTFGVKNNVMVVAGATDSIASLYSSGAKIFGEWNTTLGTVIGVKGIANNFIEDPDGLIYVHRHPEGYWLPGAGSNTGGESLRLFFGNNLDEYNRKIEGLAPTGALIYPLVRKGERFPFLKLDAIGFININTCDPISLFKGFLEGIAFIERIIYEKIGEIGYIVGDRIFSMGGGAYSLPWLKIRSNILKKNIYRANIVETAFGSAIIAASGVFYQSLIDAIENMVSIECIIEPDNRVSTIYDEIYEMYLEECRRRNLL